MTIRPRNTFLSVKTRAALLACAWGLFGATCPARDLADLEKRLPASRGRVWVLERDLREYAAGVLGTGATGRGLGFLSRLIAQQIEGRAERLNTTQIKALAPVTDAFLLFVYFHDLGDGFRFRPDVAEWLLAGEGRLGLVVDTIAVEDDRQNVYEVMQALYDHDPKDRDRLFRLILAMSVVWDGPQPPMHGQMGGAQPAVGADLVSVYNHFRKLYKHKRAKIRYQDLSVPALTFMVHLPLPPNELRWIIKNVKGSAPAWKRKFTDIDYDVPRMARRVYQWPHGDYTLAAIKEHGGICVDQAYYATLTARAHGIPALIFLGEGRRGPHAWFGYMRDVRHWELDAGRYAYDKYATGQAWHPQLNRPMTDHDVEFTCDRALNSPRARSARQHARLAAVLLQLGLLEQANQCADLSITQVSIQEWPWRIKEEILRKGKNADGILSLLSRKAKAFHRYPGRAAAIRQEQADLLRKLGREKEAAKLLRINESRLGKKRDDIARFLASEQVQIAYDKGDYKKARMLVEDLLRKQKYEGQKIVSIVQGYISLTDETKQQREAAKFLGRFLDGMIKRTDDPHHKAALYALMLSAYENAGDERKADRVKKRLQRLR